MGRSGGRSSGGRSGGGRSGGSRSSSGRSARSSGSRSSFGGSRGFSSSSTSGSRSPSGFGTRFGSGYNRPGGLYSGTGRKSDGRIVFVVIIICILLLIWFWASIADNVSGITKSTIDRQKLNIKVSTESGFYTDECGWIQNRTELEAGLKEFYSDTGIAPYVYIMDNIGGDYDPSTAKIEQFAEEQYAALFKDDGHIMLMFWDYGGAYEYILWMGADTVEFMDAEACDILFDYLDYYYYYAETDEGFFAEAFAEAGKRMTGITRSFGYYIVRIVFAGAAIYIVYRLVKKRKDKEAERKRRAEEILSTPLEKFGEYGDVIDNLEKKYEKEI